MNEEGGSTGTIDRPGIVSTGDPFGVLMTKQTVALLFDLDGTLIHSSEDLADAANHMLAELGLPPVDLDSVESWIGHGVTRLVHRCITRDLEGAADPELADRGLEIFRRAYIETGFAKTRISDGALEALDRLRNGGFPCALVTNKTTVPTMRVLERFGFGDRFEAVVCGDTLEVRKPDSGPLLHALEGCGATQGWMIGDSETDSASSAAAGLPFICISGGYGSDPDPSTFPLKPTLVIDRLHDLLDDEGRPLEMLRDPRAFSG